MRAWSETPAGTSMASRWMRVSAVLMAFEVVAGAAFVKPRAISPDGGQAHALRLRKLVGQHQAEAAVELRQAMKPM